MFIPDRDKNGQFIMRMVPFASKADANGKFFRRSHGVRAMLAPGTEEIPVTTTLELIVPYNQAKISKIDFLWLPEQITGDLEVYDSATSIAQSLSGVPEGLRVPNKMLNQFAFDYCIAEKFHSDESQYDADLFIGMKLEIHLINRTAITKRVGINFHLHEVK